VCPATGAFVNGQERFDGTTLDPITWRANASGTTISQNGVLKLDGSAQPSGATAAQYTTRSQTVAVGQFASVEMNISWRYPASTVENWRVTSSLQLTNFNGTAGSYSYSVGLEQSFWPSITTWASYVAPRPDGALGGTGVSMDSFIGDGGTYVIRMDRLTSTSMRYKLLRSDGTSIATLTRMGLPAYVAPLFVSLENNNTITTFDNVTIGISPEPATAFVAAIPLLLAVRRRV
jgi:hypothetical protein